MSLYWPMLCYVAGTGAFVRFFLLAIRLRRELTDPQPSQFDLWFPWMARNVTPSGRELKRRMFRWAALGWVLLIVGLALSPR